MIRILAIGDSHVPRRAKEIPSEILELLESLTKENLFDFTFFTGDLIKFPEILDFLNLKTKKDMFRVLGNMDYYGGDRNLPKSQRLTIELKNNNKLNIGMFHGHQVSPRGDHSQLEYLAVENKFHILISGHTHKEEVQLTKNGILLLNPGSVTGAWSFIASGIPSFIILDINDQKSWIDVNLYRLDKKRHEFNESDYRFIFINNALRPRS